MQISKQYCNCTVFRFESRVTYCTIKTFLDMFKDFNHATTLMNTVGADAQSLETQRTLRTTAPTLMKSDRIGSDRVELQYSSRSYPV